METKERNYEIVLERGLLRHVRDYIPHENVYILTDDGVPSLYKDDLRRAFPEAPLFEMKQGEVHKNIDTYQDIVRDMLEKRVSRKDILIALGGGVVGDMGGFVSATYMRGIPYINIPTTFLSQVDSSIGGKTGLDFGGVKNSLGAFHQPSLVLIDPDTLDTLSERQLHNGLAEAVKMGITGDRELFEILEREDYEKHIEEIIERCLLYKRKIVREDERETGIRKILNFGHTIGHAYEAYYKGDYLHGECVAAGMMKILDEGEVRDRLRRVLERLDLPRELQADPKQLKALMQNDKKADHDTVTVILADEIGKGRLEEWPMEKLYRRIGA